MAAQKETVEDRLKSLKEKREAPSWMQAQGLQTIEGGYLLPGETPKTMYRRLASGAAKNINRPDLEDRFFEIMWNGWLGPSTPVLSNFNSGRALPISCYSVHVADNVRDIWGKAGELASLAQRGGGVGIYFGDVRCKGKPISGGGTSDGTIQFMKIFDSTTIAVSQGNTRRGSAAVYLPVDHGDIHDFLNIRRPEGDVNRQSLNLHHAVCISSEFMNRVGEGDEDARNLLTDIYRTRLETGEPYIFFTDNVNKNRPEAYKRNNLEVVTSNICSEITLYTDALHTFVCCLSSMNLSRWDEWKDTDAVYLATYFLEGVMTEFIAKASNMPGFENAVRHATKGRALGLGVLGWHTLLQQKMLPMDSLQAHILNRAIFKHMKEESLRASREMAEKYGEPEWCVGTGQRHTHLLAVAPTASNSIIAGNVSAGIEPINSNAFAKKTAKGTFIEYNPLLKKLLQDKGMDNQDVWTQIAADAGSVRSLEFLTDEEKAVFKTAFEIDQRVLINLAASRQEYICQAQSLNLFFPSDVDPQFFHEVHKLAWQMGLNTLYYVRSSSVLKADISAGKDKDDCKWCEG